MISPFKNNFFPRPRDQNRAFLLRTLAEVRGESMITAMTVFNGVLYFATQNPLLAGGNVPRLYSWNPATMTVPVAVVLPALAGVTNTRITGMAAYNNRLWIVTGASTTAGDNGQFWSMDTAGVWTGANILGFAGWTGGAVANMVPVLFVFQNQLVAAGVGGDAQLHLYFYNGAAWADEATGMGGAVRTQDQIADFNNILYFGLGRDVIWRPVAGVYALAYRFPNVAAPVCGLATLNGQVWASQLVAATWGYLTRVRPGNLATDRLMRVAPSILRMLPLPSGTPWLAGSGQVLLAQFVGGLALLDPDGSLRTLVRHEGDQSIDAITGGQLVEYGRDYVVGLWGVLGGLGAAQATVRLAILE